ncbi:hypothetical protein CEXT_148321 [Caerostris extrusa]|uniref:Uncharacterized protein n=1 Tax=Caerostris extrusa TaxID=172846 RepID=A0AAV4TYQ5_CAEEX|nr:hypothetical protein CEXT_148321 [Caerostris extrusa]
MLSVGKSNTRRLIRTSTSNTKPTTAENHEQKENYNKRSNIKHANARQLPPTTTTPITTTSRPARTSLSREALCLTQLPSGPKFCAKFGAMVGWHFDKLITLTKNVIGNGNTRRLLAGRRGDPFVQA